MLFLKLIDNFCVCWSLKMMIKFAVLVCFLFATVFGTGSSYDYTLGNPSLWHSIVPYCATNSYLNRTYVGYTSTFQATANIKDTSRSTYGYIGVQSNIKAIIVTFRGSEDINNWMSNLDAITTAYPQCNGCEVHKGFYVAEQAVFPAILSEVKSLKAKYPSYTVLCNGHSLGAALATLTAFDLLHNSISPVKLFNYGSPRVGNTAFSNWATGSCPWLALLIIKTWWCIPLCTNASRILQERFTKTCTLEETSLTALVKRIPSARISGLSPVSATICCIREWLWAAEAVQECQPSRPTHHNTLSFSFFLSFTHSLLSSSPMTLKLEMIINFKKINLLNLFDYLFQLIKN